MVLGMILIVVSSLVMTAGGIMTLVLAFRMSLGWGLLVLFVPFANVVFLFRFWPETRRAVRVQLAGLGALLVGIVILMTSAAITGMRQGAARREAEAARARTPTPAVAWPPEVARPAAPPTATPLPEIPIGAPEPAPLPSPSRPLPLSQAGDFVGRMVDLVERDGKTVRVVIREVTESYVRVSEPYGGGGIAYSIPRERVVGFRPLRPRPTTR